MIARKSVSLNKLGEMVRERETNKQRINQETNHNSACKLL